MRITSLFAAMLAVGVAAAVGCGPGKELPTREDGPAEQHPFVPPAPTLPKKSDAAAKEIIDKAIAAHTKNNPEKLAKLKIVRVTMTGQMNAGQWINISRDMLGEWPDRFRGTWTSDNPMFGSPTLIMNGAVGSMRGGGETQALSPGRLQELRWDSAAQLWVPLLVPLADPATVVFGAGEGAVDGKPLKVVKASCPGHPVWTLGFDPTSSLLVRLAYDGQEAGNPVPKTVAFSEHKERDGLMVPDKWEMFHGANAVETSRLKEITFPHKVEAKEFTEP